jgi:hypothetical protein
MICTLRKANGNTYSGNLRSLVLTALETLGPLRSVSGGWEIRSAEAAAVFRQNLALSIRQRKERFSQVRPIAPTSRLNEESMIPYTERLIAQAKTNPDFSMAMSNPIHDVKCSSSKEFEELLKDEHFAGIVQGFCAFKELCTS